MVFFDNPLIMILSLLWSVTFTAIAALVPPNAGHLVAGTFVSGMAAFLGGEDEELEAYEEEIADEDI